VKVPFVTCDVFTTRPFAGNPLLVVPDARGLAPDRMQAIAREINFSESTFVLPPDDPRHAYRQRTFVPLKEIPYAGHPTVGTAFVLSWLDRLPAAAASIGVEVGFGTLVLDLFRGADGRVERVRMEQGHPGWRDPVVGAGPLDRIAAACGLPGPRAFSASLPVQSVSTGNRTLVVPLADAATLEEASGDPRRLAAVEAEHEALIVYLVAPSPSGGARIRARAFCTGAGVPEDPATGSAAGPLGIYLALHEALPAASPRFVVEQGAEMGRPSEIEVEVEGAPGAPTAVRVAGSAVRMMEGTIEA
jgi:trans-2,3-dihydro-3-hydroxyanthranilate isomerase